MTERIATLLVVEDDRVILTTLARGLQRAGYRVMEAGSGEAAQALLRDWQPDLALLDMRMPGISGLELARWMSEHGQAPFVFLSAYDEQEWVEQAVGHGALGYLVKPLDVAQILPTVRAALARAEELRALRASEAHLSAAVQQRREVSTAVGMLMERYGVGMDEAFEALRHYGRDQRRRLADIAADMIHQRLAPEMRPYFSPRPGGTEAEA